MPKEPTIREKVSTFGPGDPRLRSMRVTPEEEENQRRVLVLEEKLDAKLREPPDNIPEDTVIAIPETKMISERKGRIASGKIGEDADLPPTIDEDSQKLSVSITNRLPPENIPEDIPLTGEEVEDGPKGAFENIISLGGLIPPQRGEKKDKPPEFGESLSERQKIFLGLKEDPEPFYKPEPKERDIAEEAPVDLLAPPTNIEDELPEEPVRKNHGALVSALAPLGADENFIVGRIRKWQGYDKKKPLHFYDQTYTELLDDWGLNTKNQSVRSLGLGMSMMLAPFNLLTGGLSSISKTTKLRGVVTNAEKVAVTAKTNAVKEIGRAKKIARFNTRTTLGNKAWSDPANKGIRESAIAAERSRIISNAQKTIKEANAVLSKKLDIGLTQRGKKMFDFELNKRVEASMAKLKVGRLSEADVIAKKNRIVRREMDLLEQDFLDVAKASNLKATGIKGGRGGLTAKQGLLRNRIFDTGGIKYAGHTLVDNREIVNAINKAGLPKLYNMAANSEYIFVSGIPKFINGTRKVLRSAFVTDKASSEIAKDLDIMFSRAQIGLDDAHELFARETEHFFKGLKESELVEFDTILTKAVNANIAAKEAGDEIVDAFSYIEEASSPLLKRKIKEWVKQNKTMAKEAGVKEKDILEHYYPWVFRKAGEKFNPRIPKEISPAERHFLMDKKTTGVDSAGYTRLKNPIETIVVRKTEIAAANIQDKIFKTISAKFGKKFDNVLDAQSAGHVKLIDKPQEISQALLKDIDLKNYLDVYIPKEIAKDLEVIGAAYKLPSEVNAVSKMTSSWKTWVTTMFPSFHVRNFASNVVLNAAEMGLHAVNPRLNRISDLVIRAKDANVNPNTLFKTDIGEHLSIGQLRKEVDEHKVINGFYIEELGLKVNEKSFKGAMWKKKIASLNPTSQQFLPVEWGRQAGQYIENQARVTNYIYWRMQGIKPQMAAKQAIDTLFDYSDLTKAEKWFQLALPFYTFSRKNFEAQARLLIRKPGFIAKQMKLFREIGPTDEEWDFMPPWMKNRSVVKAFDTMWGHGWFPIEDAADAYISNGKSVNKLMNPMFKWALERGFGRDMLTGRPLRKIGRAEEFKWLYDLAEKENPAAVEAAKFLKLGMKDYIDHDGQRKKRLEGDPNMLHILRSTWTSRFQSTWGFLNREDTTTAKSILRGIFGISAISADPDMRRMFSMLEAGDKITNQLEALGLFSSEIRIPRARIDAFDDASRKHINKRLKEHFDLIKNESLRTKAQAERSMKQIADEALRLTTKQFIERPEVE